MSGSYVRGVAQRYPESEVLVGAAESVWSGSDARINISIDAGSKLVNYMSGYLPEALISVFITDSDIRHIKRKHGSDEEERGQITIVPDDFSCIPRVLNEFDSCEHTDTDKLGNKKFLLKKNIGGTVYLVTVQRGKRKLEIKTMWKENRSGASC
ncbi:hypothetical protein [Adlercreutzia muris]|jgi:hypothetical protein|uniref:PBECR3 domain-containing polyvalent protein n=1 Tax=Adlercreutzia muris TaxID=1796610 RepID=UPI001365E698|nr:hypothetical protein [Adlercreutzia muris]MCI8305199.1 hypothetical protein [Enterorhabdus sp.]MCI9673240.1 hypothetical protein [Enterorhabdus sp.]NCA32600.1 hypothetical protein [Adlercreutzia muris]